jgi:hypothetical protein
MATVKFRGIVTSLPKTGKKAITFDTPTSNSVLTIDPSSIVGGVINTEEAQELEFNADDFFTLTRSNGASGNLTFGQFFESGFKNMTGDSTQATEIG